MKFLMFFFLVQSSAWASLLKPFFECGNSDKGFSMTLSDKLGGTLTHKNSICSFQVAKLDAPQGRSGSTILILEFEVPDCHPEIFYRKGFMKIESVKGVGHQAFILALKGSQTFTCSTSRSDVKKLLKKAGTKKELQNK